MARRRFIYAYFESEQPKAAAWKALCAFARAWNLAHVSQWEHAQGELCLRLSDEAERAELDRQLAELARSHPIEGGGTPVYDEAESSYILVVGEGLPPGALVNELEAFGPPLPCPTCGRTRRRAEDQPLVGPLELDESLLAGCDADTFNLHNDGRLVTRRFVDALRATGATGFRTIAVHTAGKPSERYAVLAATHVVLEPCPEHTPRDGVAFCAGCGAITGTMERFFVPDGDAGGLALLSRHRFGLGDLYFARDLYQKLLGLGMRGLCTSVGFDTCHHERSTARLVRPAAMPAVAPVPDPPEGQGLRLFLEHLEDPHPQLECAGSSDRGSGRTFDVAHVVEPGCTPKAWSAIERKLPQARPLRALYERANGVLLYCQDRPRAFPTWNAICRGQADDPSFLRFEKTEAWSVVREQMLEMMADMEQPFVAADGVPFARLTSSSDLLVCWQGAVYYFSPMYNRFHNQRIARSVDALLALVVRDPPAFLMDTASVARCHDEKGEQYYPVRYLSGR
jgi:hypothetical protein